MAMNDLHELLEHELGDLLFAEKTILKGLKKMAREVQHPGLQQRIVEHQAETEGQIRNLERAFEAIGKRAKAQKCEGILGIVREHDEFASEEEPSKPLLAAFDLGSGLRVEHYEIAAYRSAIAVAKALGHREVVAALKENLEQEVAMAKFIEGASADALRQAHEAASAEAAEPRGGARKRAGATTGAAKGGARSAATGATRGATKRATRTRAAAG